MLLNQATLLLQPALHCLYAWQHKVVIIHVITSEKPQTQVKSQTLVPNLFLLLHIPVSFRAAQHSLSKQLYLLSPCQECPQS